MQGGVLAGPGQAGGTVSRNGPSPARAAYFMRARDRQDDKKLHKDFINNHND